jgi:hypothetical protein
MSKAEEEFFFVHEPNKSELLLSLLQDRWIKPGQFRVWKKAHDIFG